MNNLSLTGRMKKTISIEGGNVRMSKGQGVFHTSRDKIIPIRNISGVEVKKPGPFIVGYIQLQMAGQISGDASFTFSGGAYNAVQDENAVVFGGMAEYEIALQIQAYINNYVLETTTSNANHAQLSTADEILKLKGLLDVGAINQKEFENAKEKLLGI